MSKNTDLHLYFKDLLLLKLIQLFKSWVSGASFVPIKAFIMLCSHSTLMMNNEDRGKNSATYRRFLSRVRVI